MRVTHTSILLYSSVDLTTRLLHVPYLLHESTLLLYSTILLFLSTDLIHYFLRETEWPMCMSEGRWIYMSVMRLYCWYKNTNRETIKCPLYLKSGRFCRAISSNPLMFQRNLMTHVHEQSAHRHTHKNACSAHHPSVWYDWFTSVTWLNTHAHVWLDSLDMTDSYHWHDWILIQGGEDP